MLEEFDNDGWEQLNDSPSTSDDRPYLPIYKIDKGLNVLESREHSL